MEDPPTPSRFESAVDATIDKISEIHVVWLRQDMLLLSWIISFISKSILTKAEGCKTASEAWHCILNHFASQSRAREMQLKTQVQNMKKGTTVINRLSSKNQIHYWFFRSNWTSYFSLNDHMQSIFRGLPADYNSFVCSILTRAEPCSISNIESLLLTHEAHTEFNKPAEIATANVPHT